MGHVQTGRRQVAKRTAPLAQALCRLARLEAPAHTGDNDLARVRPYGAPDCARASRETWVLQAPATPGRTAATRIRIRQLRAGRTSTGRGIKPATPRATRWRRTLAIRSETASARNEQRFDAADVAAPEVKQPPSHVTVEVLAAGRCSRTEAGARDRWSRRPPSWRTSRPVPASAEHSCVAIGIGSSATSPRSKQSSASSTIDGHGAWGTATGPGTIGFVTTLGRSGASRRARCGMQAMAWSVRCGKRRAAPPGFTDVTVRDVVQAVLYRWL